MLRAPLLRLLPLLLVVVVGLAGCTGAPPGGVHDWQEEAKQHGTMGRAASMDLTAARYAVVGEGTITGFDNGFKIQPAKGPHHDRHYAFFHGTILDVGTGLLVLEGTTVTIDSGRLGDVPVRRVHDEGTRVAAELLAGKGTDKPSVQSTTAHREIDSAWFFSEGATIAAHDLVISNATRALLIMDGNATDVPMPLRFDATYIAMQGGSRLLFDEATGRFDRFGYAGDTESGTVQPQDGKAIARPTTVFGDAARLRFTPDGVASTQTFRLTQATTADGFAVRAQVELRADDGPVAVGAGNTTWVRVHFREHGYQGVAILENITVSGDAAPFIRVPLEHPPWLVETLYDEVRDAGFAAPFLALPIGIASPFLLLGEAIFTGLDCVFNDCPSQHPYPAWMQPGQVGRFYYHVDATHAAPGTYTGTIHLKGANHDPVALPVEIVVS